MAERGQGRGGYQAPFETKKALVSKGFPRLEAPGGFEPPVEVLQTSALPLGYGAALIEDRVNDLSGVGATRQGAFRSRDLAGRSRRGSVARALPRRPSRARILRPRGRAPSPP